MTFGVATAETCVCGHSKNAHEHLRHGSDCALCDRTCARYRHAAGGHVHLGGRMRTALQHLHRSHA